MNRIPKTDWDELVEQTIKTIPPAIRRAVVHGMAAMVNHATIASIVSEESRDRFIDEHSSVAVRQSILEQVKQMRREDMDELFTSGLLNKVCEATGNIVLYAALKGEDPRDFLRDFVEKLEPLLKEE